MAQARIPSLDGLRAVSIACVIFSHTVHPELESVGSEYLMYNAAIGAVGVFIFFVISGFIITTLLLREAEQGPISLHSFYLRRALRLLPALFAFLLFLATVQAAGVNLGIQRIHFLSSALFLVPYIPWGMDDHPRSTRHLWSLAVEEHFYLFWPPILAWLGMRRATWLLLIFILLIPAMRIVWYKSELDLLNHRSLLGLGDLMAYGALAAIWHHQRSEWLWRFVRSYRTIGRIIALVVLGSILAIRAAKLLPVFTVPFGVTIIGLSVTYLLLSVCFEPDVSPNPRSEAKTSILFRILNFPAVAWFGSISYSLYLWQQPFFTQPYDSAEWWQQFPVNVGLAVLAAIGSFYLVERPFLKLKSRLSDGSK